MIKEIIFIIIIVIIILYILRYEGKEYFKKNNKCEYLTMKDCINTKGCGYVLDNHNGYCTLGESEARKSKALYTSGNKYGPYKTKNKSYNFKWYYNDDYTRALISNTDSYRNMNNKVFD